MKNDKDHSYGGDGVCDRCSHDEQSTPSDCPVPDGQTIFDNPSEPHDYGEAHDVGSPIPDKK